MHYFDYSMVNEQWIRKRTVRRHINARGLLLSDDLLFVLEHRLKWMVEQAIAKARKLGHKKVRLIHLSKGRNFEP